MAALSAGGALNALRSRHSKHDPVRVALAHLHSPRFPSKPDPLGIEVLGGSLVRLNSQGRKRCEVAIIPFTYSIDALASDISRARPEILGLALPTGSLRQDSLYGLMEALDGKPSGDNPLVVFGNSSATYAPGHLLGKYPHAVVVIGEGEKPIVKLVESVEGRVSLDDVPNSAYMSDGGQLISTGRVITSFDDVAPPYRPNLEQQLSEGTVIHMEAGRGCAWHHCTFCCGGGVRKLTDLQGKMHNSKPLEDVVSEIEMLQRNGVRHLTFTDPDFIGGNHEIAEALARELMRRGINMSFEATIRVSDVCSARAGQDENKRKIDTLKLLQRAGFKKLFIGLESGSEKQLRRYAKGATVEDNRQAVRILRRLGFSLSVGWIPVDPMMSLAELKENVEFFEEMDLINGNGYVYRRIRVHEGSPFVKMLMGRGLLTGEFNLEMLAWEYRFQDPKVEFVSRICEKWEEAEKALLYRMITYLAIPQSNISLNDYITRFREVYFELLKNSVAEMEKDNFSGIAAIWKELNKRRHAILADLEGDLRAGRLNAPQDLLDLVAMAKEELLIGELDV